MLLKCEKPIDWRALNRALMADGEEPVDLGYGPPEETLMAGLVRKNGQCIYVFYSWGGVGDDEQGMLLAQMYEILARPKYKSLLRVISVSS